MVHVANHTDDDEAVQIHQDTGSKESFGCHFGSFQLADEGLADVHRDLDKALNIIGVSPESFIYLKKGSSIFINLVILVLSNTRKQADKNVRNCL
jgi:hypothetical protein